MRFKAILHRTLATSLERPRRVRFPPDRVESGFIPSRLEIVGLDVQVDSARLARSFELWRLPGNPKTSLQHVSVQI